MRRRPTTRLRLELLEDRSVPSATDLISLGLGGAASDGSSLSPAMSADGRYVAFTSRADNLVAGDTNGAEDVFFRDRTAGTTELVSKAVVGDLFGPSINYQTAVSADGRYVAYVRAATHLVAGDSQAVADLFVWDRVNDSTRAVGVAGFLEGRPFLSADGRYLAYTAHSSDYARSDVYLVDLRSDDTDPVSTALDGQPSGSSASPSVSDDGRYVAFESRSRDLSPGDDGSTFSTEVYVRDRLSGTTQRIVLPEALQQPFAGTGQVMGFTSPSISGDGRFVAYSAFAVSSNGAVSYDGPRPILAFVQDRSTGGTEAVPEPQGGSGFGWTFVTSMSRDGRFVALSHDSNPPGDAIYPGLSDKKEAVLWDAQTGAERVIELPPTHAFMDDFGGDPSPAVSDDGRYLAFAGLTLPSTAGDPHGSNVYVLDTSDPSGPTTVSYPPSTGAGPPSAQFPDRSERGPPAGSIPLAVTAGPADRGRPSFSPSPSATGLAVFFAPDVGDPLSDAEMLTTNRTPGSHRLANQTAGPGRTDAGSGSFLPAGIDYDTRPRHRDNFLSLDPTLTGTLSV